MQAWLQIYIRPRNSVILACRRHTTDRRHIDNQLAGSEAVADRRHVDNAIDCIANATGSEGRGTPVAATYWRRISKPVLKTCLYSGSWCRGEMHQWNSEENSVYGCHWREIRRPPGLLAMRYIKGKRMSNCRPAAATSDGWWKHCVSTENRWYHLCFWLSRFLY
jgi:hypothetical protein